MAGVANFGGKKAAPFGSKARKLGKKRAKAKGLLPKDRSDLSTSGTYLSNIDLAGYQPKAYDANGEGSGEPVTCPNCGKGDALDARYCDQCGFKLVGAKGVKVNGKVVDMSNLDLSKIDAKTALKKAKRHTKKAAKRVRQINLSNGDADLSTLSTADRKALPASAFVFPNARKYPIHDEAHARDALARSSGKPEAPIVRAAVKKRFPNIGK